MRRVSLVVVAVLVSGCAGAARSDLPTPSPPPAAYKAFTNTPPEQGGLRSHQAVITESDVTVYRLYDGRVPEKTGVARREGVCWADFTVDHPGAGSGRQLRGQPGLGVDGLPSGRGAPAVHQQALDPPELPRHEHRLVADRGRRRPV